MSDLSLDDIAPPRSPPGEGPGPWDPIPLTALWYAAFSRPLGIWVRCVDPIRAKQLLYSTRTRLADPDLAHLEIRTSPTDPRGTLWLINPGVPDPEPLP